ncbi:LUZP1 protein, partial [Polypterus senegalus]
MADISGYKDASSRHLRHKLQSLSRRLDELEEATKNLQKAEDELLDLQDKIIQAEGSSCALLNDVDLLRKRVLKIEGKDEEVRKAEDLCRLLREKLEAEESLSKQLKSEIERLQRRMSELEKLEDAFSKSKSDCTQLCLSLNEEKNLTKKLSSELEMLRAKLQEIEASEGRLDKAEVFMMGELEKLKSLRLSFLNERKSLLDKQKQDEQMIRELTLKLEQNNRINSEDQSRNYPNLLEDSPGVQDLRIEDSLSSGLSSKMGVRKKNQKLSDDVSQLNKSENEKNEGQEDNKVKELTQEIERLKNRLKQLEVVEENFKKTEAKNGELQETVLMEKNRSKALSDQLELLKSQINSAKIVENGKAESEEINVRGGFRHEKPRFRSVVSEPLVSKNKVRETSPHQRRGRMGSKEVVQSEEGSPKSFRSLSPSLKSKKTNRTEPSVKEKVRGVEIASSTYMLPNASLSELKKVRDQPSVLSRYPPAANDQIVQKNWRSSKIGENEGKKSRLERSSQLYCSSDMATNSTGALLEKPVKSANALLSEKEIKAESRGRPVENQVTATLAKNNSEIPSYRSHVPTFSQGESFTESSPPASETESTGPKRYSSLGETGPLSDMSALSIKSTLSKYPRYAQLQESLSEGSSSRSSFEEDPGRLINTEGGSLDSNHTISEVEIRRVCSPREALRSKVVIKPAIVEIDRKEVMGSAGAEPFIADNKPKSKPSVNKVSSSITIYPNEPASIRTCGSSTGEVPKERHTSTSNIMINSSETRSTVPIPYEISIPKSDITLKSAEEQEDELVTECKPEAQVSQSSITVKPLDMGEANNNNNDMASENCRGWRSQHGPKEDSPSDMKNVTVRSTWRNRLPAPSLDEAHKSKSDIKEADLDSTTTWRAYRATTIIDGEEISRISKPSPAEIYMRRINNNSNSFDTPEHVRRSKSNLSSTEVTSRTSQPHEPVIAQELTPRNYPQSFEDGADYHLSSRRRLSPADLLSDRLAKPEVTGKRGSSKNDLWQNPESTSVLPRTSRSEGRTASRPWKVDN